MGSNTKGPSTKYSYVYPKVVLKVLVPKTQVPIYWVLGPSGQVLKANEILGMSGFRVDA